jgi:hypothetical protein
MVDHNISRMIARARMRIQVMNMRYLMNPHTQLSCGGGGLELEM